MHIKIIILLLITIPFLFTSKITLAENIEKTIPSVELYATSSQVVARKLDNRAKSLAQYLAKFNSPIQYHAQDFIDAADTYNLDWRLLPSIAGVESTFGKRIPGGYNAWGWGVYGNQAIYFKSWKDGIFTIAKGLRENYINKGYTEPYSMNRIYAASPHWGRNVSFFMEDLKNFTQDFEANNLEVTQINHEVNIAAVSGQLALQ